MKEKRWLPGTGRRGFKRRMAMRSVAAYLFAAWCVVPLIWLLSIALHPARSAFSQNPFSSFTPTIGNFSADLSGGAVTAALGRSGIVVGVGTAVGVLVALPLAYVLTHIWDPDGKRARRITLFFLATTVAPPIVVILPMFRAFDAVNLVGSLWGLAALYSVMNLSLAVLLLRSYLGSVPFEVREAALVDGANEWRAMISCVVPVARGGLVATAILCVLQTWNEFLFALVLVGGQQQTLPIEISSFLTFEGVNWGGLAAASVIAVVPILLFSMLVQRDLSRGISFGAVK